MLFRSIGTSTPQYKLEINGTIAQKTNLGADIGAVNHYFNNGYIFQLQLGGGNISGLNYIGTGSSDPYIGPTNSPGHTFRIGATGVGNGLNYAYSKIYFNTQDIDRMIINSTGNVGIGTMSPATTLDVAGQMQVSGSTTFGGLMTVSGGMTVSSGTTVGSFQFTSSSTVVSAITTTIGAGSTDFQIPTAKAVQTAVSAINSTMIVQNDTSVSIADEIGRAHV